MRDREESEREGKKERVRGIERDGLKVVRADTISQILLEL